MKAPSIVCPQCGASVARQRNPSLAVDVIIRVDTRVVLIERKNPPAGWALPGGFVDYGESLEQAAMREVAEETGLELSRLRQFRAYSDPGRDPRGHVVSVVFSAVGRGTARAADDARKVALFAPDRLPANLAFDHARILADYFSQEGIR
ncbi:8-oxo-dGTP diphosphatase [Desulfacinum hydrothermale DSM 13146]|uniref:8-oxo-dGTP diphosphatase n=1 Tax=Desulfacinum hydrothermale DSM 13146 TaxID=1121390 RepID=A0A1W1XJK7_9BACT|nr:NUDIX hydrolase [Desulfacinum hydrothermale]SMC23944.1 8-oxo-dGTP diphosphatase [Desulfacinum hydrothermale DSM 13146]